MSSPSDPRYQRAVTRIRVLANDEGVRIMVLFFLAVVFAVTGVFHYLFFSTARNPERIHIVMLSLSFFMALYLSIQSSTR